MVARPRRPLRKRAAGALVVDEEEHVDVAVILAVIALRNGGDGWESNPPRTPQQRPANGFEDREASVWERP